MRAWRSPAGVLDVKLEEIAQAFDPAMARVFRHLGLTEDKCEIASHIASTEDVDRGRQSDGRRYCRRQSAHPFAHLAEMA